MFLHGTDPLWSSININTITTIHSSLSAQSLLLLSVLAAQSSSSLLPTASTSLSSHSLSSGLSLYLAQGRSHLGIEEGYAFFTWSRAWLALSLIDPVPWAVPICTDSLAGMQSDLSAPFLMKSLFSPVSASLHSFVLSVIGADELQLKMWFLKIAPDAKTLNTKCSASCPIL
jgi:hypothetical protein